MEKHWNYRLMAHEGPTGIFFQIHEVHYEDNVPVGYTEKAATILSEASNPLLEISESLAKMKQSLGKPIIWGGSKFPEECLLLKLRKDLIDSDVLLGKNFEEFDLRFDLENYSNEEMYQLKQRMNYSYLVVIGPNSRYLVPRGPLNPNGEGFEIKCKLLSNDATESISFKELLDSLIIVI